MSAHPRRSRRCDLEVVSFSRGFLPLRVHRYRCLLAYALRLVTPTLDIRLSGPFQLHQLERLVLALGPLAAIQEPHLMRLDMSGVSFVCPTAIATLATVLADRLGRGMLIEGSAYTQPRNWLVAMYLSRMNFNRLFSKDTFEGFTRREAQTFTPCLWIDPSNEAAETAEPVATAAGSALTLTPVEEITVELAVTEMVQNVLDHAQSPVGGFVVAQGGKRKASVFELAIADPGLGISASLRRIAKYESLDTDLAGIQEALKPGVTSNPEGNNSGVGLSALRNAVRQNGGTLIVRSGTAVVESGRVERSADGLAALQGTLVAVKIRQDAPFPLTLGSRAIGATSRASPA